MRLQIERAAARRTQRNENKQETRQLDPTSIEASEATMKACNSIHGYKHQHDERIQCSKLMINVHNSPPPQQKNVVSAITY